MNPKLCPLLVLVLSVCCAAALGDLAATDETPAERDVPVVAQNETQDKVENEDKIELHHVDEGASDGNETDPVVRKKRTFGDVVFRGLADVLGYRIQRKPPQVTFPPPVAPLYLLAAAPATTQAPVAQPAFAFTLAQAVPQVAQPAAQQAPAAAPCLVLRAGNALPPCARPAAQQAPRVTAVTLCARPRVAPAAQQAAPCVAPAAQQAAPCAPARAANAPCGPAAAAGAAAPADAPARPRETVNSNFQLNFNWNRNNGANLAVAADPPVQAVVYDYPAADDALQPAAQPAVAPVPLPVVPAVQAAPPALAPLPQQPQARIAPRPARLPPPRKTAKRPPKVFIDAFVDHGNGITQKVNAADIDQYNPRQYDEERAPAQRDYDYDQDYANAPARDDYDDRPHQPRRTRVDYDYDEEEPQESKSLPRKSKSSRAQKKLSSALTSFWDAKAENGKALLVKKRPRNRARALESQQNYQNVHFGDRALVRDFQNAPVRKKAQYENLVATATPKLNRVPQSERRKFNEAEKFDYETYDQDDNAKAERTTTTEDPNRILVPAILPPTELNPNKIDTVTVRVPPIYKAKKPKRLHKAEELNIRNTLASINDDDYEDIDHQVAINRPRQPQYKVLKRSRTQRSTELAEGEGSSERDPYSSDMYDYFGKLIEASPEELEYRQMTVPTPAKDADLARVEDPINWEEDDERSSENERTDKLSGNAKIVEHEYKNNFVTGRSVQVDDPEFKSKDAKKSH